MDYLGLAVTDLPGVTLRQGHVLDILASMEPESVHAVVTSPPFFGLRKYSGEQDQVWGGKPECEHQWVNEQPLSARVRNGERGGLHDGRMVNGLKGTTLLNPTAGATCSLCGAWRGALGLEPTPDLFIQHLMKVMAALWRVLRRDGVAFINLDDSRPGGAPSHDKRRKGQLDSPSCDCSCHHRDDALSSQHPTRRLHTYVAPEPKEQPLTGESIPTHKEEATAHCESSGSASLAGLTSAGSSSSDSVLAPADEPVPVSQVSKKPECSPQSQAVNLPAEYSVSSREQPSASSDGVPLFSNKMVGHDGELPFSHNNPVNGEPVPNKQHNDGIDGASRSHKPGKPCAACASRHYTMLPHHHLKPKDMALIPERFILAAKEAGWYVRSKTIWALPNPMPESCTDRPSDSFQMIYMLARSEQYWYDMEAVREKAVYPEGERRNGSSAHKSVGSGSRTTAGLHDKDWLGTGSRNLRNVWTFPTRGQGTYRVNGKSLAHFAAFPPELPRRAILASCPPYVCAECGAPWVRQVSKAEASHEADSATKYDGLSTAGRLSKLRQAARARGEEYHASRETLGWTPTCGHTQPEKELCPPGIVLDAFCGSGTTLIAARQLGRQAIGIDLSQDYIALSRHRLERVMAPLYQVTEEVRE